MLGAFLTLTQVCIEVVRIVAADAVLDPLLRRDRPPDTLIECSIWVKSMELSTDGVCPKVRKQRFFPAAALLVGFCFGVRIASKSSSAGRL